MNTQTADIVREELLKNPFLLDYLRRDLLNVTALARDLLPHVKQRSPKATVESIAVAIQRIDVQGKPAFFARLRELVKHVQLTIRTDVTLMHMAKHCTVPKDVPGDDVLFVNQGPEHCTVLLDAKNAHLVKGTALAKTENLGILAIKDTRHKQPANYRNTPGFIYLFISAVSREGINIVDVFTGPDSVNLVLSQQDLLYAFAKCNAVKTQGWF